MNNNQQPQIVDKLKSANNILVTVSANPSVDQLAACIGLTLLLNKLKKHATAVFSGTIPSTIEFLKPEETLEKNTDSLRDFIIALDKSKADKLRYKVEENVVKIFITPYRTSITQDDLDFSQGDFNVDVVVALGVHEQQDLDQAITAHGRILHDAVVTSINTTTDGELGTVNWTNPQASSLSELVTVLADTLGKDLVDTQIATALLTGIVAETDRFSNAKTSPQTMKLSAELMTAGANQQLVATQLQEELHPATPETSENAVAKPTGTDNGTLEIEHAKLAAEAAAEMPLPPIEASKMEDASAPSIPEEPKDADVVLPPPSDLPAPKLVTEPPRLGGQLTANTQPEGLDPAIDPLSLPEVEPPILKHDSPMATSEPMQQAPELVAPEPTPAVPPQIHIDPDGNLQVPQPIVPEANEPTIGEAPEEKETLSDIEQAVQSPHLGNEPGGDSSDVDNARSAVMDAINSAPNPALEPIAALNAQPVNLDLHDEPKSATEAPLAPAPAPSGQIVPPQGSEPAPGLSPADKPMDMPLPPSFTPPADSMPPASSNDPSAPPPVPPPIPPDYLNPNR